MVGLQTEQLTTIHVKFVYQFFFYNSMYNYKFPANNIHILTLWHPLFIPGDSFFRDVELKFCYIIRK